MGRLPTFDYTSPFFYMVTIKKARGARRFAEIVRIREPPRDRMGRPVYLRPTAVTRAFSSVVRGFHLQVPGVAPITCFIVMPDHLHLLIRLLGTVPGLDLGQVVDRLRSALAAVVCPHGGAGSVFEPEWHDWIVKRKGQLARFTRYVRRNPRAAWMRATHPEYFTALRRQDFLGRPWFAYGNAELLEEPVLVAVRGHRATPCASPSWNAALARARRIGPGGVGIGTYLSPLEKACGNAIAQAGGGLVILRPEGFPPRWHPSEKLAPLVAEGRVLLLSLYAPKARRLSNSELWTRCHEMGELVAGQLPRIEG